MCLYMENNYIIVNRRSFSLSQHRAGSRKFEKVNKFLFQQICEQKFQKMDQSGSKHMPNWTNITEAVHPIDSSKVPASLKRPHPLTSNKCNYVWLLLKVGKQIGSVHCFSQRYKITRDSCITWGEMHKMSEKQ